MKRAYIDTDVILDLLLQRDAFFNSAVRIFALIETGELKAYASSLIIWNIYYLLEKYLGKKEAKDAIRKLRLLFQIIAVNEKIIDQTLSSDFRDFEDTIQYFAARSQSLKMIVTRNKRDYPRGEISILTPEEFLRTLGK